MFPFDIDEKSLEDRQDKVFKEYEINFKTGQLTGRTVTGVEAIKVWAWLALKTARYSFQQFSWNYGSELDDLIGKGYAGEHVESEVKRMVTDCLKANKHIKGIRDFTCSFEDGKITAAFTIITDYGEADISV